jgi:tetratricopeptide (TPR) repeat protein
LYKAGTVALETNSLQGGTPLHWAAAAVNTHDLTVLKTLVETCGANMNAKNQSGMTAIVLAAAAANDVHCKYLVQAGADCTMKLPGNVTLYHMAADLNLVGTLAALLERTKDSADAQTYWNCQNDNGETPLDLALQEGNLGCVMLLTGQEDEAVAQAQMDEWKAANNSPTTSSNSSAPTTQVSREEPSSQTNAINADEQEAMEIVSKIAGLNISDNDIQRSLEQKSQGNEYFKKRKWQESLKCYTQAIELNPTDATFYSNRSACYMELGQPQEALKDAVVARKLKPTWSKACYRMAVARCELGRYEDAAVAAFEGLQQDQSNEELQRLLRKCVEEGQKEFQATQKDNEKDVEDAA